LKYIIIMVIVAAALFFSLAAAREGKAEEVARIDQEMKNIETQTATFALG